MIVGLAGLPVTGFVLYDRLAPLPRDFMNLNYPFLARLYIRRALLSGDILTTGYYLDWAMQKVLESGLGAASPESTALVIYLSRRYLELQPSSLPDLEASFAALTHKPHVGEGVREERARLEMAFQVALKLCEELTRAGDAEKSREYARRSVELMQKGPPYITSRWKDHPIKEALIKYQ